MLGVVLTLHMKVCCWIHLITLFQREGVNLGLPHTMWSSFSSQFWGVSWNCNIYLSQIWQFMIFILQNVRKLCSSQQRNFSLMKSLSTVRKYIHFGWSFNIAYILTVFGGLCRVNFGRIESGVGFWGNTIDILPKCVTSFISSTILKIMESMMCSPP